MRIERGRAVAQVADEMGISRPTAYTWWRWWREEGELGLVDRSSRAHRCSHQTSTEIEAPIAELRQTLKLEPGIGGCLSVAPSTVHRVLNREGINRLK
jgi:transposase-like protein